MPIDEGIGDRLEVEQEAAQGSGEEQMLSEAETAAREEAERLVQVAEDAEDIASAAVERLNEEVADVAEPSATLTMSWKRSGRNWNKLLAALEAARGALQAALIVLEVAEAAGGSGEDCFVRTWKLRSK